MADTTEDAEAAAERLEAALERIAKTAADARRSAALPEIRERLDLVIGRLRAALKD